MIYLLVIVLPFVISLVVACMAKDSRNLKIQQMSYVNSQLLSIQTWIYLYARIRMEVTDNLLLADVKLYLRIRQETV